MGRVVISFKAPAKINLFLHVLRRREDGYHDLQTVFQLIDWCDDLQFELTSDGAIVREPEHVAGIAHEDDLTCRAALMLQQKCRIRQGVRIRLKKNIPIGAGLGGGSSDAAATLKVLNKAWGIGLNDEQLVEIGAALGADVPFFLNGYSAWGEGVGEKLHRVSLPARSYLVAVPDVLVSTREIFTNLKLPTGSKSISPDSWSVDRARNDLEPAACACYPQVEGILAVLRTFGPARMSGSGGAVFLPVSNIKQGRQIAKQLPASTIVRICNSFDVHPMHVEYY